MTLLHVAPTVVLAWLLAMAFAGAAIANAAGVTALRSRFVRWGYPPWWNLVTSAVEGLCAALLLFPATRILGLALAAVILTAVLATLILRREFKDLPPGVALAALTGIELALVVMR